MYIFYADIVLVQNTHKQEIHVNQLRIFTFFIYCRDPLSFLSIYFKRFSEFFGGGTIF